MATATPQSQGHRGLKEALVGRILEGESLVVLAARGMGRTTLLRELRDELRQRDDNVLVVELGAIPGGSSAAWLRDAVDELAREAAAQKDEMWDGEFAELAASAADADADAHALLRVLRDQLLAAAAAYGRVVFVLDDLRESLPDADEETRTLARFFKRLMESRRAPRLTLLASDTPDLVQERAALASELVGAAALVSLAPLSWEEARRLMNERAPELDAESVRFAFDRVGGNPALLTSLAEALRQWIGREGALSGLDRESLAGAIDTELRRYASSALAQLRGLGGAGLVDTAFRLASSEDDVALAALHKTLLLAHGLLDEYGRMPLGFRREIGRSVQGSERGEGRTDVAAGRRRVLRREPPLARAKGAPGLLVSAGADGRRGALDRAGRGLLLRRTGGARGRGEGPEESPGGCESNQREVGPEPERGKKRLACNPLQAWQRVLRRPGSSDESGQLTFQVSTSRTLRQGASERILGDGPNPHGSGTP